MEGLQRIVGLARGPKSVQGADPAANAEVGPIAVPAGKFWRLLTVSVSLVQGLTQTPQPILTVDDGTNVLFEGFGSSAAQAASTTCRYTWASDLPLTAQVGAGAGVHSMAPLPEDLVLQPGWRIRTQTLGIGANSDYGVPSLLVLEYGG